MDEWHLDGGGAKCNAIAMLWTRAAVCCFGLTSISYVAIAQAIPNGCNSASMAMQFQAVDADHVPLFSGQVISEGDPITYTTRLYTFDFPPVISCWNEGGAITRTSRDFIPHVLDGPVTPYGIYDAPELTFIPRASLCLYQDGFLWWGVHCDYSGGYMVGYPAALMAATDERWLRIAPACHEDTDGNGSINVQDLMHVIEWWGEAPIGNTSDVDANGIVDIDDLLAVLNAWGKCP